MSVDDDRRRDGGDDDPYADVAIGVGMGGSCPVCRAPIDLGQEFCLECGSPIRFTARQRRVARATDPTQGRVAASESRRATAGAPERPFPWVPFLIVLALVAGGIAFAFVDRGGDKGSNAKDTTSTEDALPQITNSIPDPSSTTPAGTVTLQDCDPARPLNGSGTSTSGTATDPGATGAATTPTDTTGATIPEILPNGGSSLGSDGQIQDGVSGGSGLGVPSTTPDTGADTSSGSGSTGTVTVDQNNNACPDTAGTSTDPLATTPTDTTGTAPATITGTTPDSGTTSTSSTGSATSGTTTTTTSTTPSDWPASKTGWTVIVSGSKTKAQAQQRESELEADSISAGVLFSSDYGTLCPGFWVVFSGVYESQGAADDHRDSLVRKGQAGLYVRKVAKDGQPTGCST